MEDLFKTLGEIFKPKITMYAIGTDEFECIDDNGVTYYVAAHSDNGEPIIEYVSFQDHNGGDHETDHYPERLIEEWLTDYYYEPSGLDNINDLRQDFGRHFN